MNAHKISSKYGRIAQLVERLLSNFGDFSIPNILHEVLGSIPSSSTLFASIYVIFLTPSEPFLLHAASNPTLDSAQAFTFCDEACQALNRRRCAVFNIRCAEMIGWALERGA